MADKKISELDAITGANTAATDVFVMVDTSTGETKKITREELNNAIEQDVLSTVDINGGTIDGTTIGGSTPAAGSFTTADIDGGTIDGTTIGGSTPAAGTFTTLDATGAVVVGGDLTVNGTTTTINSTTLTVDDKNIELASGAADAAAANGAGITIDGASATFNYASTGDKWTFNKPIDVTGNIIVSGTVDGRDVATDGTKLDGIETGATADQDAAEIRTLVDSATDSNVFTDADHTKLDGIEAGATADQDAAEIRALVDSATDSNVFTDADHTKLDGIATGATNVSSLTDLSISDGTNGQVLTTNGSGTFTFADVAATDAQTLDGIDSSQFLRSDANDTFAGTLTLDGSVIVQNDGVSGQGDNNTHFNYQATGVNYIRGVTTNLNGTTVNCNARIEMSNELDMNNYDIQGVDQIVHHGDTNTYIQFHASDQFRVVTGGTERLEVNNSGVNVAGNPVATTQFNTVGSYCLAHHTSSNSSLTANANIGGSSLRAVGFYHLLSVSSSSAYYPEEDGTALSGSWRVMGEARDNSAPTTLRPATLFVRYA